MLVQVVRQPKSDIRMLCSSISEPFSTGSVRICTHQTREVWHRAHHSNGFSPRIHREAPPNLQAKRELHPSEHKHVFVRVLLRVGAERLCGSRSGELCLSACQRHLYRVLPFSCFPGFVEQNNVGGSWKSRGLVFQCRVSVPTLWALSCDAPPLCFEPWLWASTVGPCVVLWVVVCWHRVALPRHL